MQKQSSAEIKCSFFRLVGVAKKNNFFPISSSSCADNQIYRDKLAGENVPYECICKDAIRKRPEMNWAVEASMPLWTKEKRGTGVWDFRGELGNLQVAKTELNTW